MNETEKRIHEAALVLFSKKGFAATSIRDIADEVQINSASIYYYIQSKDELLFKVMDRYMDELLQPMMKALQKIQEPVESLTQMIQHHVEKHSEQRLAALVVDHEFYSLNGTDFATIREKRKQYEALWEKVLKQGKEQGVFEVEDVKITAYALIGLCTGVAQWFQTDGRLTIQDVTRMYINLGLNMVRGKGELYDY